MHSILLAFCDRSYIVEILLIVKTFFKIVCYLSPLIVSIISIVHIFKVVMKGKEDDLKDALKVTVKRIIAGLVICFLPALVNYVFTGIINASEVEFLACFESASKEKVQALRDKEKAKEDAERKAQEKEDEAILRKAWEEEQKQKDAKKQSFEEWKKNRDSMGSGAGAAHSVSDKTDYGSKTLNVTKAVDTNVNNPDSGLGDGRNKYRAVQNAAFTGKHVVYAQNRNYGSIESSSKGGRICWSELSTGKQVKCVEVGAEGGHMDGLAYDNDRGYVLKTVSGGRLLQLDNKTMEPAGYVKIPDTHVGITYVPKVHSLVGEEDGKLIFYKYNNSTKAYERDHVVQLQGFDANAVQGIGTDGTNIFIADSSPWDSKKNLYTYSLDGQKLEVHSFGSGFGGMSDEVESAFGDNDGNLYLACPQGIAKVENYRANKIGLPT